MEQKPNFYSMALVNLRPGSQWSLYGEKINYIDELDALGNLTGKLVPSNLDWLPINAQGIPSKNEIENEVNRLEKEWEDKRYQRQRQPEYPPLSDLADALYWQAQGDESKMTAYLAAVDAVKQKYPKE